jgi:hypothetical protein
MSRVPSHIWRVSLLWQGTLLDTATVHGRARVVLRTGETFDVDGDGDDDVGIRGAGVAARVASGGSVGLPSGRIVTVERDRSSPRAPLWITVDSTFVHATMLGVAATVCMFSALWFAPLERFDEGGAGLPANARRWLTLSGGAARSIGRPVFAATGRPPHEAERLSTGRRATQPALRQAGSGPSLERTLEAMNQALRGPGGDGTRDAIGDLARAIAAAPVLGAGIGGLSPRDPADAGAGSGVVAAGTTAQLSQLLRGRTDNLERSRPPPPPRPTYPVQLVDVPDAAVDAQRVDATPDLDPFVREQLMRAIRLRSNVLRACYESWGLSVDRLRSGRLVVELTLLPDGHVDRISTTTSDGLDAVGTCVTRAAAEWYLGDGLVDAPTRLSFPFVLKPRSG